MSKDNPFVDEILEFNTSFVEGGEYEPYATSMYPNKKVAILACMDTRLVELLPAALGLKNGDVVLIKNAGAVVSHPFGSVIRSLLIAVYSLDVDEILVIGHRECGMQTLDENDMIGKMKLRGVTDVEFELVENCGADIENWLHGFESVEESVRDTVWTVKDHPLIPKDVEVYGLIMDPATGKLERVDCDEQL